VPVYRVLGTNCFGLKKVLIGRSDLEKAPAEGLNWRRLREEDQT